MSAVIVDTNILVSCLVANNEYLRNHLFSEKMNEFYSPKFVVVELFKHKERIVRASRLDEDALLELLYALVNHIHFYDEELITLGAWAKAIRLCRDCDPKDTPYVALTLHLNAQLWTRDKELIVGLQAKGFNNFYHPISRE